MKRLRHPIRSIREPFGKAGLIVACLALIAALGGTALAAAKLNGTQKKEVEKIAKKFAGKPGAAGAAGANGTNGTNGAKGDNGAAGTNGKDGTSATAISFTGSKGTCTNGQGGIEVTSAGATTYVCNGEKGETGFAEKVPGNKSLTGVWGTSGGEGPEVADLSMVPISFALPVIPAPTVYYIFQGGSLGINPGNPTSPLEEAEIEAGCPGTPAQPKAEPGFLCVFTAKEEGAALNLSDLSLLEGGNTFGVVLPFHVFAEQGYAKGSWAVTAGS